MWSKKGEMKQDVGPEFVWRLVSQQTGIKKVKKSDTFIENTGNICAVGFSSQILIRGCSL